MAVLVNRIVPVNLSEPEHCRPLSDELGPVGMLDILQTCLHANSSEWIFLRALRVGTGHHRNSAQRLDAFALNCYAHTSMKRICYEIKTSRADFLCEMKHPLKRRIGLRYSNEFYFVTLSGLLDISEIPVECGLIEIEVRRSRMQNSAQLGPEVFSYFAPEHQAYCRVVVPAPWRETPGPTWQLAASMLRNQKRAFQDWPPKPPAQQQLEFAG
ncbi:MAG TPA: hypothetical protein VGK64_26085 [Bryobacteraceae bacterium]